MRSHAKTGGSVGRAALVAGLVMGGVATADPVGDADFRYTFGISNAGVQLSNGAIKFQGRISQGKMPIAQGEIMSVSVRLIGSGNSVKCSQDYGNITVTNSILNLDFQPTNCVLDNIVALNPDLQFQLVINGSQLKPIAIGTVPYALKANYAVKAQEVHFADVAAQSHYAHRVTADRQALALVPDAGAGTGYFDFFTHPTGGGLYGEAYSQHLNDGFIQWTPTNGSPVLHIAAKGINDDQLRLLEALHLESKSTVAHGRVTVDAPELGSPALFSSALTVRGGAEVVSGLTKLSEGAEIDRGLVVKDYLGLVDDLQCEGNARVNGALRVDLTLSASKLATLAGGATVKGGLTVEALSDPSVPGFVSKGDAKVDGSLGARSVKVEEELTVTKASHLNGGATANGELTVSSGATFRALGPAQFGQDGGVGGVDFYGPVRFSGPVTITGELSGSIPAGSVTDDKIAPGAVTASKIADGGVRTNHIAAGAVTKEQIAVGAVTADTIADGAIPKWIEAQLGAGYRNLKPPYTPCAYYRNAFRRVYVRCAVWVTAGSSAPVLTLPPGYRPAAPTVFFYDTGSGVKSGHVYANGDVAVYYTPPMDESYEFGFDILAEL